MTVCILETYNSRIAGIGTTWEELGRGEQRSVMRDKNSHYWIKLEMVVVADCETTILTLQLHSTTTSELQRCRRTNFLSSRNGESMRHMLILSMYIDQCL